MCADSKEYSWKPLSCLLRSSEERIALIQLNTPLGKDVSTFKMLWGRANVKAVVDGAVNELHKHNKTCESNDELIPDLISGDFDSILPDLMEHYRKKGAEVVSTPDQNETDFTKCLRVVVQKINKEKISVSRIVAYVSFNGRFDHILSNVNALFTANKLTNIPTYLLNDDSLACLLQPGKHVLSMDSGLEGSWCGLIPVGCPCDHVTTSGLKWNLDDQPMKFGGLISTSNKLDGSPEVHVKTDKPLLWTLGIKS